MTDEHEYQPEQDDDSDFDEEPIEGYCMRDRMSVEMEDPLPVWTRKGMPATQGTCPVCGGTVFRMGRTHLHREAQRPKAVTLSGDSGKRKRPKLPKETVYVSYAPDDEAQARQIAADLEKSGLNIWLHEPDKASTQWAGGVHPALKECGRMVVVLSPAALNDASLDAAWTFFKGQRKPIVLAQVAAADVPDAVRRSPRYDFSADYKRALRQMLGALSA